MFPAGEYARRYFSRNHLVSIVSFLLLWSFGMSVFAVDAQESNRAGIVVRLRDNEVLSQCIAFDGEDITGFELLERSGFDLASSQKGLGALVCGIEETGCPANDCFCACKGGDECEYWSYWHQTVDGWRYSQIGASVYRVGPGEVDGWSWGPGSVNAAIEPPLMSFNELCSGDAVTLSANADGVQPSKESNLTSIVAFSGVMLGFLVLLWFINRMKSLK